MVRGFHVQKTERRWKNRCRCEFDYVAVFGVIRCLNSRLSQDMVELSSLLNCVAFVQIESELNLCRGLETLFGMKEFQRVSRE